MGCRNDESDQGDMRHTTMQGTQARERESNRASRLLYTAQLLRTDPGHDPHRPLQVLHYPRAIAVVYADHDVRDELLDLLYVSGIYVEGGSM